MSPWRGTYTALVTPFASDGSVDEAALRHLVAFQLDGGVEGLVPCGTTGEAATLSADERRRVVEIVCEATGDRGRVIAGAGHNATSEAAAAAREMAAAGAHAVLSVVPYYNKPTQEGLYRHFATVADSVDVPIVLYNVPSRTGTNLRPETVARLAAHGNVCAVKEASGDLVQVAQIIASTPDEFRVLSGEDNLTLPLVCLGGDGVISVVSNEVPDEMSAMVRAALAGRLDEARAAHYRLLELMNVNFVESNPIPVKAALAMRGLIAERYRLPLVEIGDAGRARVAATLERLGLGAVR